MKGGGRGYWLLGFSREGLSPIPWDGTKCQSVHSYQTYLFQVRPLLTFWKQIGLWSQGLVLDEPKSWVATEILSANSDLCLNHSWQLSRRWSPGG